MPTGSPFDVAAFGAGKLECRVVGAQLRITNLGAPLYTAGEMYGYVTADINTDHLSGNTTAETIMGYRNTRYLTMSQGLKEPLRLPLYDESAVDITRWINAPASNMNTYVGGMLSANGMVVIPMDINSGAHFRYEFITHWEVRGRTATPLGTTEMPEPTGFWRAAAAVNNVLRSAGHYLPSDEVLHRSARLITFGLGLRNAAGMLTM